MAKASKLDKAIQAIIQAIEPIEPSKASKAGGDGGKGVYCPSCQKRYPQKALRSQSRSGKGMPRSDGGPTGAWRETWRCCPKGHRLIMTSRKIS